MESNYFKSWENMYMFTIEFLACEDLLFLFQKKEYKQTLQQSLDFLAATKRDLNGIDIYDKRGILNKALASLALYSDTASKVRNVGEFLEYSSLYMLIPRVVLCLRGLVTFLEIDNIEGQDYFCDFYRFIDPKEILGMDDRYGKGYLLVAFAYYILRIKDFGYSSTLSSDEYCKNVTPLVEAFYLLITLLDTN